MKTSVGLLTGLKLEQILPITPETKVLIISLSADLQDSDVTVDYESVRVELKRAFDEAGIPIPLVILCGLKLETGNDADQYKDTPKVDI